MIAPELRREIRQLVAEAVAAGARRFMALKVVGLSARCLQRWRDDDVDRRKTRVQTPRNALSDEERQAVLAVTNAPEHGHLPVTQIVPRLADKGEYIASESTMYRVLRAQRQLQHRALSREPTSRNAPRALVATAPNQVATWDITWLPAAVRGHFWYLYVVIDLFSRKAVAWQVYAYEDQSHASDLIRDYVFREVIAPNQLTLHADNGAVMRGASLQTTLKDLGIASSHSRPSVSNDNPFIESLFKTIKYRPNDPSRPFATLNDARAFADRLLHWYNTEHRHSAIRFVTPEQRHQRIDVEILKNRHAVYQQAKRNNPNRWSRHTRNWTYIPRVYLNPNRVEQVGVSSRKKKTSSAANQPLRTQAQGE
jgi:transposase InsO family protein